MIVLKEDRGGIAMRKQDGNSEIMERLDRIERLVGAEDELMDTHAAAKLLGLSRSYLLKLTMKRALPFSKPGGKKILFSRRQLIEWAKGSRVKTAGEIDAEAASIVTLRTKKAS
jgi:excisionase family DNA binding protein